MKIILFLSVFLLCSCSTVNGVGRDVQDAGSAIQYGISDIRDSLKI